MTTTEHSPSDQQLEEAVEVSATYFEELYIDYFDNYSTVARFASDRGFSKRTAEQFIGIGLKIHCARAARHSQQP